MKKLEVRSKEFMTSIQSVEIILRGKIIKKGERKIVILDRM